MRNREQVEELINAYTALVYDFEEILRKDYFNLDDVMSRTSRGVSICQQFLQLIKTRETWNCFK